MVWQALEALYAAGYKSSNSYGEATPARIPGKQEYLGAAASKLNMQFFLIKNSYRSL